MFSHLKNIDSKEVQLPETLFIHDVDTRVFQALAIECLSKIEGIALIEGNIFDTLLGREIEKVKGIHVVQDQKGHSIELRVEVKVRYGISIPEKAEEIQMRLSEEMGKWTGLHVASIHVIFKDLISEKECLAKAP